MAHLIKAINADAGAADRTRGEGATPLKEVSHLQEAHRVVITTSQHAVNHVIPTGSGSSCAADGTREDGFFLQINELF